MSTTYYLPAASKLQKLGFTGGAEAWLREAPYCSEEECQILKFNKAEGLIELNVDNFEDPRKIKNFWFRVRSELEFDLLLWQAHWSEEEYSHIKVVSMFNDIMLANERYVPSAQKLKGLKFKLTAESKALSLWQRFSKAKEDFVELTMDSDDGRIQFDSDGLGRGRQKFKFRVRDEEAFDLLLWQIGLTDIEPMED